MSVWRMRACRMTLVANFLSRLQGTGHLSECASRDVIHKKLSLVSKQLLGYLQNLQYLSFIYISKQEDNS
jgi:hypothetical protein